MFKPRIRIKVDVNERLVLNPKWADERELKKLDIKELDRILRKDPFHVDPYADTVGAKSKYYGALQHIASGDEIFAPVLDIKKDGKGGLYDGRHTFAVLRDINIQSAKIGVRKSDIPTLKKLNLLA